MVFLLERAAPATRLALMLRLRSHGRDRDLNLG
jgi:hypothetical protein